MSELGRLLVWRRRGRSDVLGPSGCHRHDEAPVGVHQVAKAQTEPNRKDPRGIGQGDQAGSGEHELSARHRHGATTGGESVLHPGRFRPEVRADCDGFPTAERAYRSVADGARTTSDVLKIDK